jgi:uncharacterized protein (TIGR02996 family)
MTHPPRFLRTILACPQDDAPRLAYARWLDGHGDPLGEFIRLQCLLSHPPLGEPLLIHERREQQLLADFHAHWASTLADWVEWCSFHRGFIEEISLTEKQFIRHAAELVLVTPICDVHLTTSGNRLDALPELPDLKHTLFLDISAQPIGDEGGERLADAPLLAHVHGLNLGCCHLGDTALDALIDAFDLDALRELYLNNNPISDDSVRRFVLSPIVEQLQMLDVRNTQISEEGIAALRRILGERVLC